MARISPLRLLPALAGLALATPARAETAFEGEIDLLEVHLGRGDDHLVLDSTFTIGGDANRFVLKLEGGSDTRTAFDDFGVQALYARQLGEAVTVSAGIRHDFRQGSDLAHAALAVEAELPGGFAVEHFACVSQHGDVTGAAQIMLGAQVASGLTLEPRFGFGWAARDIPREALASGFTDIEASARLRQRISDNLDVYVGVIHERLLGDTRAIARDAGDPSRVTRAVIGAGASF